jgi:hydrogenase maturation protease
MQADAVAGSTLILGIGNSLLTDDGVGIHVIKALDAFRQEGRIGQRIELRDGGTIGLALLSEIEDCGALIAVDAMEMGAAPGTVRAFEGTEMDRQLGGRKRSAHEVALADLLNAAQILGHAPERRALVAIQPGSTQWGLVPTAPVKAAIAEACDAVHSLLEGWNHEL